MINKTLIKTVLVTMLVTAAVKKFAPLSVKKYL
jgi:hypothetical protein